MSFSLGRSEIQNRVKKGYLDRLDGRVRAMRKLYAERRWPELLNACHHLSETAGNFGLPTLAEMSKQVENLVPAQLPASLQISTQAKEAIEALISTMDSLIVEHQLEQR